VKTIPLTKGMVALVDDGDFEFVSHWSWYASEVHGNFYARRDVQVGGKRKRLYLHRILAGAAPGQNVDHKDRCTLNNQRHNLRACSQTQNMGNCGMQCHNTSGFKGVSWSRSKNKWVAQIRPGNGQRQFIGRFKSPTDAAQAYDRVAREKYGRFALTNEALGLL
jgi:hypothetical protein